MKVLEKITLVIFSIIILVISLINCLLVFNWLNIDIINNVVLDVITGETSSKVLLVVSIVFILLCIKNIFFMSKNQKDKKSEGILLENEDGRLLISIDTIQTLVNSVVIGFEGVKESLSSVILDKNNNNVKINLNISVLPNVVIKELSYNIQTKIKETIKKSTDLDVKEIEINVINIAKIQEETKTDVE